MFIKTSLIILLAVLAISLEDINLLKASILITESQPKNLLNNKQTATKSSSKKIAKKIKNKKLWKITLPPFCHFYEYKNLYQYREDLIANYLMVDCGRMTKNNARQFMGRILESQGWRFCYSALVQAAWIKDDIITTVVESENNDESLSYPFRISQMIHNSDFECER